MAKSTRRALPLEPLPPVNHLLSTKDTYPDSLVGKDITKPRDIYTFLSLGYLPVNQLQWPQATNVDNSNVDRSNVKFSLSTITTSSKQWDDALSQNSYFHFDAQHPITGFPVLPAITRVSSASCQDEDDTGSAHLEGDPLLIDNLPRKSIINEEDHKIRISTTYIFAPTERLHETVKYNKHVTLPKIKPKKGHVADTSKSNVNLANQKSSFKSQKDISAETSGLSPRKSNMYQGTSSLFGIRPECIFLTNQLGDRNPLCKHNKESPTPLVPKAGAGMNDLKDYEGYPEVYWELRDQTIAQPEDLEADMIDRDLYRLRQISNLKLNTIERTFQVTQDPFRKWRSKTGEPIFSPRQQQRPCNRISKERGKVKDIPVYPQHVLKPIPGLKLSRLKLGDNDSRNKHEETPLSSSRDPAPDSSRLNQLNLSTSGLKEVEVPIGKSHETPRSSTAEPTPRDMLAASLDTYRRLEEERDEQLHSDKDLSIQKLHQLKGKREKKVIKTALVQVDLDSVDTYKREHRAAPKRQLSESQHGRSLNNSVNRDTFGRSNLNSSLLSPKLNSPKLNSSRSLNDKTLENCRLAMEEELTKTADTRRESEDPMTGKQAIKAPVASILFNPHNERVHNDGEMFYQVTSRPGIPSPNASDSSIVSKERQKKGDTPLKHVRLEVFAERRDPQSPIKIPTGRTTYHPHLPSCRLDLANYPPSNARQTCGRRSNSAGLTDGRQTASTHTTRPRGQSSEGRSQSHNIIPPRSGDNSGVNIRFGGQGKVIVTSSREGRRSR